MDKLQAIATFVRAAELGSFLEAARAQGSTTHAVSEHIRQLEQHIGVRLFHRAEGHATLTEEGQRLFDSMRGSVARLVAAVNLARRDTRDEAG